MNTPYDSRPDGAPPGPQAGYEQQGLDPGPVPAVVAPAGPAGSGVQAGAGGRPAPGVRCQRCGTRIEWVADVTGGYWRHVGPDVAGPHAAAPPPVWGTSVELADVEPAGGEHAAGTTDPGPVPAVVEPDGPAGPPDYEVVVADEPDDSYIDVVRDGATVLRWTFEEACEVAQQLADQFGTFAGPFTHGDVTDLLAERFGPAGPEPEVELPAAGLRPAGESAALVELVVEALRTLGVFGPEAAQRVLSSCPADLLTDREYAMVLDQITPAGGEQR